VSLLSFSSAAQDPSYYRRQETWEHTLLASLQALNAERGARLPVPLQMGPWRSIGPFRAKKKDAFAEVFPPERGFEPESTYEGGSLRWMPRPDWHDGSVVMFPQTDYCAIFLSRTLTAARDTVVEISLGSDDGIKVWLDGTQALSHDVYRGAQPDQEELDLTLSRGEHRLLLKINNGQGDFGFYFAVVNREMRTLLRAIARDFPDEQSRREIAWESEDGIWARGWTPGDFAEPARRYAEATLFDTEAERSAAVRHAEGAASLADLDSVRKTYIDARVREVTPVVLTPRHSALPRINGARVFGARPGHPFLFTIPVTGTRPVRFEADGLPAGLALDRATGRITGTLESKGTHHVTLRAVNAAGSTERSFTIVAGDQIALTPPLGWNSWNCFASAVDDAKVRAAADAMVTSGLIDHGWTYINIDDCWEVKPDAEDSMLAGEPRTPEGRINTNRKFPDMKALSDYVHGKGLKLGIYSSPGPLTCAGFTASYQFETRDAAQYAAWGIDYLKYDWCSYGSIARERTRESFQRPYRVMRKALDGVQRDIVFSLCQYGMGNVWEWGGDIGGNSWRTTVDIEDTWKSMSDIGFAQAGHEAYAKPGNWNDPDMLVVGKVGWGPRLHPTRLTPNEQYTHITLWSLLAAPLLIGCDMTQLDAFTFSLLSNDEVLAVNQDPLGKQAGRIWQRGEFEVWAKDLEDGSKAVGLFNRGNWKSSIAVSWEELGLEGPRAVRDLWRQEDLGEFRDGITRFVPRHGAVLLRVGPPRREP
ncbi:MAG TPA: putative Ig domain-containing protein, partial [Bacteroidota bacterium]|nr:putative Ig domain-containing protein [Bacteroidota bacterium]